MAKIGWIQGGKVIMDPNDKCFRFTENAVSKKSHQDQQQNEHIFSHSQTSPFDNFSGGNQWATRKKPQRKKPQRKRVVF